MDAHCHAHAGRAVRHDAGEPDGRCRTPDGQRRHRRVGRHRHGGAHPELDQQNAQMLPMHRVVGENAVVEKLAAEEQAEEADADVEQQAACDEHANHRVRRDPAGIPHAVDEGVEDEPGAEDHPCLKAAAGPEVAVKLHIEGEEQNERHQELGGDAKDQMPAHGRSP